MTDRDETGAAEADAANPLLAEVTRGTMVESRHRAAVAVADAHGAVVVRAGDIERPVYARSAIKAVQTLPLVETGAAAAYGLGDSEIALACASHHGQARHVETVLAWLTRIGCTTDDLECGAHLPYDRDAAADLLKSGADPGPEHNNCSGKHAGFLTLARHLGVPIAGYIRYEHPVQQRVVGALETMAGLDLGTAPRGIDGCGIPVVGIPLGNLALAMARLGDPHDQPEARQAACARVLAAVRAEPFLVGGTTSFTTRAIAAGQGRAVIKDGAEGVACGVLPELGLGFAVKADDGAERAAAAVTTRLLQRFEVIDAAGAAELVPPLRNRADTRVGEVRIAADCPF